MALRLLEDPLGADAAERPTREEVDAVWAAALARPVPDYDGVTLTILQRAPAAARGLH